MHKLRLVMVGNGMAGVRTLEELLKLAPDLYDITVFGAEPHPNYNRIMLSPVLAGEQSFEDIILNDLDWYRDNGVTLHAGRRVVEIDRRRCRVIADDGTVASYDRLLLATGSSPFILPVPGNRLAGVIGYRDIADTELMVSTASSKRHAVVIGGGLLGLEAANGLKQRGMDVTVVHIGKGLLDRQLDATAAAMLQSSLESRGIRFQLSEVTQELVDGGQGQVVAVRLESGLLLPADLVFYIGCRAGSVTTERWRSPEAGTTVVHLDSDPAVIGACYQTKAAMVCDARLGLEALISELGTVASKNGAARALTAKTEKWKAFSLLAASEKMPIKPERVLADLAQHLPADAVVCADPGTPCPYFSAWFEWQKPGRHFITNRAHGALGFAIGASIGAQIGRPNAKVICATGDGSFGMSVGELETMKRLNLPITILVFSNSVFGWIKAGQKSGFGARYFSVDFSRTDHAAVAAAYGIKSFTASNPADLSATLKKAIHYDGPTLVDIISEPLQDSAAPVSEWVA